MNLKGWIKAKNAGELAQAIGKLRGLSGEQQRVEVSFLFFIINY